MLKIAIDTQPIQGLDTEIGLYAPQLVRSLERIDRKHDYLSLRATSQGDLSKLGRWWWDQVGLPRMAQQLQADVLHRSVFSAPRFFKGPVVVTLHDLSMFHSSEVSPQVTQFYPNAWLRWSYRFADRLIVLSEDMKQDAIKVLKVAEARLSVVNGAADLAFRPLHDVEGLARIRKKYRFGPRFLLHVAVHTSQADILFLLRVFAAVKKKVRTDWQLVIVGRQREQTLEVVRQLGLEHAVILLGSIEAKDKSLLYNAASIFVHPSSYEGAGLGPLEAMSCGLPIIASMTTLLPEIVGSGGILLSPTDIAGWTKALVGLMTDASLRREYSGRARKQARRFSWERTARETVRVYDQAYREHLSAKRLY